MLVSIYRNSTDTIGVEADHLKILGGIKAGRWKAEIENLRTLLQSERADDYARSKRQLPAATFGGTFSRREMDAITQASGMMILDIDKLQQHQLSQYREAFEKDVFVHSCFISPSDAGLKIIMKYDADSHLQAFLQIEEYFKNTYAIKLDPSGKDISRLCYVSYDPDLYLNEESMTFVCDRTRVVDTSNKFDKRPEKFKEYVVAKDAREIFKVAVLWTERHHQYVEGNRNNYIHVLACNLNRAGVFHDDAMLMIFNQCSDLDFKEVEQTVDSAYKNKFEHGSIDVYSMPVDQLPEHSEATEMMNQQEEIVYLDTMAFLKAGINTNLVSKYIKNFGSTFLGMEDKNISEIMNQAFAAFKGSKEDTIKMGSTHSALFSVIDNYKDIGGVPTPVKEINDILNGGLMPGNLYGSIGDGGSFKSIWAHCIGSDAANIKNNDSLIVYMNGEMSELQLMDRVMNKELKIELQVGLKNKTINKDNINDLANQLKEVLGENFQIVSSSGWNAKAIGEKVKEIEQKLNKKASLIVVDGLTHMEDIKRDEIKSAIHNSGQLKELAKDTNTAIIALVHVSGNPAKHHRDTSLLIRGGTKLINNMDAMFCHSRFIDEQGSNFQNNDIMYLDGMFYIRFIDKRGSGKIINKAIKINRPLRLEVLDIDPHMMEVDIK